MGNMKWWMTAALLVTAVCGYGQPFTAIFSELDRVLTTNLDGSGNPLPDGTPIWIYWDRNHNGPDELDIQPPLLTDAAKPEVGAVNANVFELNGSEDLGQPGKFYSRIALSCALDVPPNPYYYLKVIGDGVAWYSNTFTLASGPQEVELSSWTSATALSSPRREAPLVITEYKLHENFPNPFNNSTMLTYDLVEPRFVKLTVFNVLGQNVVTLVNSEMTAGRHRITFDATSLSTGVYMVRLEAGSFKAMSKMLLLK